MLVRAVGKVVATARVVDVVSQRLLAHHMLAVCECTLNQRRMLIGRSGNDARVDTARVHTFTVCEGTTMNLLMPSLRRR